jgi:hypothetical protein
MSKPIPTWKILTLVLVAALLATLATVAWIRRSIERRWADMRGEVLALNREAHSRSGIRPVLRGELDPGRAWKAYDEAFTLLRGQGPWPEIQDYVNRGPASDRAAVAVVLDRHASILAAFRRAFRRSDGQRYRDWQNPETPPRTDPLVELVRAQVRFLAETGEGREAAYLSIELLQFCSDFGRNGSWTDWADGVRHSRAALVDLKELVVLGTLSRVDLSEVERDLLLAEQSLPNLEDVLLNTVMEFGCMILDFERLGTLGEYREDDYRASSRWRFAFSKRAMIASALFSQLASARRLADAHSKPWARGSDVEKHVLEELESSKNPFMKEFSSMFSSNGRSVLRPIRELQTQIRMLRAAARYRASGDTPEVDDPFGTTLQTVKKDGRLKMWSIGSDGVNHGGMGDWNPSDGKDIVLEVGP